MAETDTVVAREPFSLGEYAVDYVLRYGGRCRECADNYGVCPFSKLPCAEKREAVVYVFKALNYGFKHGFLAEPSAELARLQAENEALRRERDELRTCAQDLPAVLEGTADRLVRVLGDNPKITFVLTLRECAKRLNAALKA